MFPHRLNMRCFVFCKQKTAYELRISDWSSDVCSSDLALDFLIKGNAIRIGVIGDGQFVITIAVFYHGVVAFQHRLNPLPSGFSTSSTLVEVLDNQMQGDAGSGRLFRQFGL